MTQGEILEQVIKAVPTPEFISDIDLSRYNEVRFTWRSNKFRVTEHLLVDEVEPDGCLVSNTSLTALLEKCLSLTRNK